MRKVTDSHYSLSRYYGKTNFELQYVEDEQEGIWTLPALLTKERADKFCNDLSAIRVKLTSASFIPLVPGKSEIKEIILELK